MPRILVSGYYGFDNVGDDTVLFGIISSIRSLYPAARFVALSNQPERTRALFHIEAYNRWSFPVIFRQLIKADLLIVGGGTLLQDVTSRRSISYYLGIVALAKVLGKRVVFYGQGFGPVNRPFSQRLIRYIANRVDLITVRDDKSADDFRRCGVKRPPLHVTADPALGIDPVLLYNNDDAKRWTIDRGDAKSLIGVAIRSWPTDREYIRNLATACDELAIRGNKIVFLPMQYPNDLDASRQVQSQMRYASLIIDQQLSFREVASIISTFDLVIGMRLHALILAALYEVPFVPISYDPKIDRFVQRLGLGPALSVTDFDAKSVVDRALFLLQNSTKSRAAIRSHLPSLRKEALKTAELTVALFRNHTGKLL